MPVDEQLTRFKAHLERSGLKLTVQREVIARLFFESTQHHSLSELHDMARHVRRTIGFATVYRTMKLLAESGLAVEHRFADDVHTRYEPSHDGGHHDHLICVQCGKILEVEDEAIERLQEELAHRFGFQLVGHRHEIYGNCQRPNCEGLGSGEARNLVRPPNLLRSPA